jgi:sortase (surface protein transpeptidase)
MHKAPLIYGVVLGALIVGSLTSEFLTMRHNAQVMHQRVMTMQQDTTTVTPIKQSVANNEKVPVSIAVPRLGVQAAIQPVGLDKEGRMATIPDAKVIAWYAYGSVPGGEGNAILAGHRDWNGALGTFWRIETLKPHDIIRIGFSDGNQSVFEVVSDTTYPSNNVPNQVMQLSGLTRTTLITCAGDFDHSGGGYQSRAVVILQEKHSTTGG